MALLCAGLMFSCAGKKFDYATAYKFKPQKTNHLSHTLTSTPEILSASAETEIPVSLNEKNEIFRTERVAENVAPLVESKKEIKASHKLQKLTKKIERKVERKLEKKAASGVSITGKVYAGLVIGAAGLVLMILGGSTLSAIGSIGLLAGVILIVWGLLE